MKFGFILTLAILVSPLVLVFGSALGELQAWRAWNESGRLGSLLLNTLGLAAVSAIVAVPLGILLAFALERGAVPGTSVLRGVVLVSLFVPLPVLAVAWQIVLGSWLPSLALAPGDVVWRLWNQGLLPAGVVHGIAALPWVAVIVGLGLRTADRGLEEDAFVTGGPGMVVKRVLLPRMMLAALAALAWVAVQAATEIPITDAMMVRTFAEEVYTQIVGAGGVQGAILVTLPVLLVAIVIATCLAKWLMQRFPNNPEPTATPRHSQARLWLSVTTWLAFALVFALPLCALIWKSAGGGVVKEPSLRFGGEELWKVLRINGRVLVQSLLAAIATGLLTAWFATSLTWAARHSKWKTLALLIVAATLALTPGPIVGQGLKDAIQFLLDWEEVTLKTLNVSPAYPPLRSLLYDQPSPLPTILTGLLRFLPLALLIVAPVIRAIPRDLEESSKLDGVDAWMLVGQPLTRRATRLAAIAVAGMTLAEVSAGKLVAPPGWRLFILDLFDQMHYGAEPTIAAMALVQLLMIALVLLFCRVLPRR